VKIGVPREIKVREYRVGMTPSGVRELIASGHQVLVEAAAGAGVGYEDAAYVDAGASIAASAAEVFGTADLIVKVKEPQPAECAMLRSGQTLFTYLHLAAAPEITRALMQSGATCIAYETVTDGRGGLPLLRPMSEIAGRMAPQVGAYHLQKAQGGCGVLLGGAAGVLPAKVAVLGGGIAGFHAADIAIGMRADVTILDISLERLAELDRFFGGRAKTAHASRANVLDAVNEAHLVIGAVLVPGASAPKLVRRSDLSALRRGAVLVDVAIDQGGCFETSRPTTHDDPAYTVDGIVHYCVANMPGAVARTSTEALTQTTVGYVTQIAELGVTEALRTNPHLADGLNIAEGRITHPGVAKAMAADLAA